MLCVFCFKQKTAYEMRISDWSSDVCSSDLVDRRDILGAALGKAPPIFARAHADDRKSLDQRHVDRHFGNPARREADDEQASAKSDAARRFVEYVAADRIEDHVGALAPGQRSDEHPSELQSLMRIS